jgi:tRNA threonylcarbamoyladenosine biosynthesis protein TsaE
MNTDLKLQIKSTSTNSTELLGRQIGERLRGGEVIELISDLGGGKTTLTHGIVLGAGSNDPVASPTFTISRVYEAPLFSIHHFDFYRLSDPGIMAYEIGELIGDANIVAIVEWGDIVANLLPQKRIIINLKYLADNEREIEITVPKEYSYILEAIQQ